VLDDIRRAFEDGDALWLRKIGNRLAEEAAIEHDKKKAQLSVISYALSKILSKPHFSQSHRWNEYRKKIIELLKEAAATEDVSVIDKIERAIEEIDRQDGIFIKNVTEKARAKMALRAYGMGISLSLAAQLFGTTKEEVASYAGQTKVHDEYLPKIGIKERLDALKGMINESNK